MNSLLQVDKHYAQKRLFEETIVFVPFFFGKKEQLKKHAEMVTAMGFNCVTFTLSFQLPTVAKKIPYSKKHGWGLKHIWTEEITSVLDSISGNKIIFSFSNPTSSTLEAIAARDASDIKALVCDGGPFYDLWKCNWNFFTYESPFKLILPAKFGAGVYAYLLWTQNHEKELCRDLKKLPKNFPILSIRGWLDPLVPTSSIEKAFEKHKQLDLEVLNLPEGKHLDGLKNFPEVYTDHVGKFLSQVATKI